MMKDIIAELCKQGTIDSGLTGFFEDYPDGEFRTADGAVYVLSQKSWQIRDGIHYVSVLKVSGLGRCLLLLSQEEFRDDFTDAVQEYEGVYWKAVTVNWENTRVLHRLFPFTRPISLKNRRTTFGCGDRLGIATSGHLQALEEFPEVYPILAQQSMRELSLTGRTYRDVVADVSFQVFHEDFRRGYGADGDHLKTIEDIDTALDAGMPMITLDLSDQMHPEVVNYPEEEVDLLFDQLPEDEILWISTLFEERKWEIGGSSYQYSLSEIKQLTLLYLDAVRFTKVIDSHLRSKRGEDFDLEISIDETTTPTLPEHHLFIVTCLKSLDVSFTSIAPRFVGEFQKGVDYRGDVEEFKKQFDKHAAIQEWFGDYKLSIHSGSDKYSVFPIIGKRTGGHVHVKTSGTSWLEALRVIATENCDLYRRIHTKAKQFFPTASTYYHVGCDVKRVRPLDETADAELVQYLVQEDSRQLVHITYGGILAETDIKEALFRTLYKSYKVFDSYEMENIKKHLTSLFIYT